MGRHSCWHQAARAGLRHARRKSSAVGIANNSLQSASTHPNVPDPLSPMRTVHHAVVGPLNEMRSGFSRAGQSMAASPVAANLMWNSHSRSASSSALAFASVDPSNLSPANQVPNLGKR